MNTFTKQNVVNNMADLLEEATMLFVESPEEAGELENPSSFVRANVRFEGRRKGDLDIAIPQAVLEEIVSNQLGLDADEIDEEVALDAAGELANLLAGRILGDYADADEEIRLSKPVATRGSSDDWGALHGDENTVSLLAEDEPFLIRLMFEA